MKELKLAMIGLDTSHCPAFAKLLEDCDDPYHVPGARIVAAWPGGSERFAMSRDRVAKFTAQMRDEFGVRIVDSIEAAVDGADAVLLESVDGRQHLEQFARIAPFGRPVFIDKPLTASLGEARAIIELSEKHGAPFYSCSSLRYSRGIAELGAGGRVGGCEAFGPAAILDDFPGLFWYGIHSAEILFSKMGWGCREVVVRKTELADAVTGTWDDGRVGTVYGYRIEKLYSFGCTVFTAGGVAQGVAQAEPPGYALLLGPMIEFFRTRVPPVDPAETLEIIAFLEAANESRETGAIVRLTC